MEISESKKILLDILSKSKRQDVIDSLKTLKDKPIKKKKLYEILSKYKKK
jgi:hypothetical protein